MALLHRQVFGELLKIFTLVVSGLTIMLMFVGVVGEAAKSGLGPRQIVDILPYIVPSLLPFTIPATLLLTVCVVYGRMSSDNEITATKAAGINVMTLIWPSFVLGAIFSAGTLVLTDQFIPWSRGNIERIVLMAMEDIFLDVLTTRNQVNNVEQGVSIAVLRVEGRRLISPTIRYTPKDGRRTITIQAAEAVIRFDIPRKQVLLELMHGTVSTPGGVSAVFEREQQVFPMQMRDEIEHPRNLTLKTLHGEIAEIEARRAYLQEKLLITSALAISQGNFNRLNLAEEKSVQQQVGYLEERLMKVRVEIHTRISQACSCFFFVTFGSPLAIWLGKKQFLTNFMICFMPILGVYYPTLMLFISLAKGNHVPPEWGMWVANGAMSAASMYVLRKVLQH